MQPIGITTRPSSQGKSFNLLHCENVASHTKLENGTNMHMTKEVEPIEPAQTNTLLSNTFNRDFSWLYFENETLREKQDV